MCKGKYELVDIKISADLSHTGKPIWRKKKIDKCIASIVKALQEGGINMRGSCCGHGKMDGNILLENGRKLIIKRLLTKEERIRRFDDYFKNWKKALRQEDEEKEKEISCGNKPTSYKIS